MGRHKLYYFDAKGVRDRLNHTIDLAAQMHELETKLVTKLIEIDLNQLYVRYGYYSLKRFCVHGLGFTRTQAQRITTRVRREILRRE